MVMPQGKAVSPNRPKPPPAATASTAAASRADSGTFMKVNPNDKDTVARSTSSSAASTAETWSHYAGTGTPFSTAPSGGVPK